MRVGWVAQVAHGWHIVYWIVAPMCHPANAATMQILSLWVAEVAERSGGDLMRAHPRARARTPETNPGKFCHFCHPVPQPR